MADIVGISKAFNAQLVQTVKAVRAMRGREITRPNTQKTTNERRYSAKLLGDLEAVEDPFGVPATTTAVLYARAADGSLEPIQQANGDDLTVTVEWRLDFSLEANQYVQLERINGAWSPYVSSCSPVEGSSAS